MLIAIQSKTPCTSGLIPTAFRTSVESDAPMKNMVMKSDQMTEHLYEWSLPRIRTFKLLFF